ncbi:MAG: hypothetical protein QOH58_348 [Thermoleophilaceae bacterium]|jgi:hypothetical protein|nr:hypothetical protein [Thermoleophilaceae bacterium]
MTPHQRRIRELEALRRVIADCEAHISASSIPTEALATTFETHTSALPEESQLKKQLEGLAKALRRDSATVVAQSRLRRVLMQLRQKADDLGRWVEARDAKLGQRG